MILQKYGKKNTKLLVQTGATNQHDDHVCLIMLDISDKSSAAVFWRSVYASRIKNICHRSARESSAKCLLRKSGKGLAVGKAQRRIQKSRCTALEETNTLVVSETLHACKETSERALPENEKHQKKPL